MKTRIAIVASLGFAVLPALAAQPPVDVRFTDPTKFTDLRYTTSDSVHDTADLADEFRRYLERRTPAYLPAGKRLEVTITNVDMAGELRPSPSSVYMLRRQIRGIYPPRVDLEFRLVGADGSVERQGHRELRDAGFLWSSSPLARDRLVHEKALLDLWIRRELGPER